MHQQYGKRSLGRPFHTCRNTTSSWRRSLKSSPSSDLEGFEVKYLIFDQFSCTTRFSTEKPGDISLLLLYHCFKPIPCGRPIQPAMFLYSRGHQIGGLKASPVGPALTIPPESFGIAVTTSSCHCSQLHAQPVGTTGPRSRPRSGWSCTLRAVGMVSASHLMKGNRLLDAACRLEPAAI